MLTPVQSRAYTLLPPSLFDRHSNPLSVMGHLPPELALHISKYLKFHKPSLIALASLNSNLYQLIIPTVYEQVAVSDSRQILAFCRAITSSNKGLETHVKSLYVDSTCERFSSDSSDKSSVIGAIFATLNCLINLNELALMHHSNTFFCPSRRLSNFSNGFS